MSSTWRIYGVAVAGALLVIGLFWWGNGGKEGQIANSELIKVGAILPLTGPATYYGEQSRKGIEIAKEEIKQKYPNLSLEVVYEDSQYTPQGGVTAYQNLKARGKLDAIISGASQVSVPLEPLVNQDSILQMAIFASAANYTTPNDLSFRVSATAQPEMAELAKFIKEKDHKRLAGIYLNNDFGVGFWATLKDELKKQGASTQIVAEESHLLDTSDYRTQLTKIKQSNPDVVFHVGTAANMALILKQASELGLKAQFLAPRGAEDPILIKNAGDLANGVIYTYAFDAQTNSVKVTRFVELFQQKHQTVADSYAAEAYEGLWLVADAFEKCDKDYACIKDFLHGLRGYDSLFGELNFDHNGDVQYGFFLKTVKDGKFIKLEE